MLGADSCRESAGVDTQHSRETNDRVEHRVPDSSLDLAVIGDVHSGEMRDFVLCQPQTQSLIFDPFTDDTGSFRRGRRHTS
ncbi:MAG: hypothetical protein JWP75_2516 [Frondihabitans sp.]|nr:hypothetical protein [Frondihabitans sp.]